ncbi:MAG: gas vesicle protein [Pseudonocardia sp.]|nr:gas vesicle protein [Pseudonocardia sp.]
MTGTSGVFGDQEVALVDLLDRLLAGGVVLTGDLTISLAGVDLVRLSLRALLVSIGAEEGRTGLDRAPAAAVEAGPRVPEVPG